MGSEPSGAKGLVNICSALSRSLLNQVTQQTVLVAPAQPALRQCTLHARWYNLPRLLEKINPHQQLISHLIPRTSQKEFKPWMLSH